MIKLPEEDTAVPLTQLKLRTICKDTFRQLWVDETATYSCDYIMLGVLVSGMLYLTGWMSV